MSEPILDWSAYDSYGAGDAYAALPASGGSFGKASAVCIGNRQCQRDEKGVMCPSYRATHALEHSTQHRAATIRRALNGELGEQAFSSAEMQAAMDLCVACKGCKRECPNGTDMGTLRAEVSAQRWRETGKVPLRTRLFASMPRWVGLLRRVRWLIDLRGRVKALAVLGERVLGIAAQRSLLRPAAKSFLSLHAVRSAGPEQGREVALFIDTFSNQIEPAIAEAALSLLVEAGCRVHIVRAEDGERPLCCGRTAMSAGLIDAARGEARRMIDALWPFVERDVPVVGLEPSCLFMLRDEFAVLGLGERAQRVAKNAVMLEEFLAKELAGGRIHLAFDDQAAPARVHVHGHCHQKAFGTLKAMRKLLGSVPNLEVEFIESSCCGMAGSFGLEAEHYEVSMRMAELSLLPKLREAAAQDLIVASGTSCRHQIRDGVAREAQHLAQLLHARLQRGAPAQPVDQAVGLSEAV